MQMNRDYSSDISNLLDLAVRYKSAEDEREYRDLALLAEKEYRKQNMEQDLDIATINILSNQYKNLYDTYEKLIPVALEHGINVDKILKKNKDQSPDLEETLSTAGNSLESLKSGLESDISNVSENINSIGKDIAIRQSIKNQIPGLYTGILGMSKGQSLEDLYTLTPQETGSYFEKNPNALMIDDQPYIPNQEMMNIIAGELATMGREDYSKTKQYKPNIIARKKVVDGQLMEEYVDENTMLGQTVPAYEKAENVTAPERQFGFYAKTLSGLMANYQKTGDFDEIKRYLTGSVGIEGVIIETDKKTGKPTPATLNSINDFIETYSRFGNTQTNPPPVNPNVPGRNILDVSKYEEP